MPIRLMPYFAKEVVPEVPPVVQGYGSYCNLYLYMHVFAG